MSDADVDQRKPSTNRALTQALGAQLAELDGSRPHTRDRLKLEPQAIRFGAIAADHGNLAKPTPGHSGRQTGSIA
jgi:hypothetical protein